MIGRDEIEGRLFAKNGTGKKRPSRHHVLATIFLELSLTIDEICEDSREKSIAMERLEEAYMWAEKAHRRDRVAVDV